MVTIEILQELTNALSTPTVLSPTPYGHLFSQNRGPNSPKYAWQVFAGVAESLRYIATFVSK